MVNQTLKSVDVPKGGSKSFGLQEELKSLGHKKLWRYVSTAPWWRPDLWWQSKSLEAWSLDLTTSPRIKERLEYLEKTVEKHDQRFFFMRWWDRLYKIPEANRHLLYYHHYKNLIQNSISTTPWLNDAEIQTILKKCPPKNLSWFSPLKDWVQRIAREFLQVKIETKVEAIPESENPQEPKDVGKMFAEASKAVHQKWLEVLEKLVQLTKNGSVELLGKWEERAQVLIQEAEQYGAEWMIKLSLDPKCDDNTYQVCLKLHQRLARVHQMGAKVAKTLKEVRSQWDKAFFEQKLDERNQLHFKEPTLPILLIESLEKALVQVPITPSSAWQKTFFPYYKHIKNLHMAGKQAASLLKEIGKLWQEIIGKVKDLYHRNRYSVDREYQEEAHQLVNNAKQQCQDHVLKQDITSSDPSWPNYSNILLPVLNNANKQIVPLQSQREKELMQVVVRKPTRKKESAFIEYTLEENQKLHTQNLLKWRQMIKESYQWGLTPKERRDILKKAKREMREYYHQASWFYHTSEINRKLRELKRLNASDAFIKKIKIKLANSEVDLNEWYTQTIEIIDKQLNILPKDPKELEEEQLREQIIILRQENEKFKKECQEKLEEQSSQFTKKLQEKSSQFTEKLEEQDSKFMTHVTTKLQEQHSNFMKKLNEHGKEVKKDMENTDRRIERLEKKVEELIVREQQKNSQANTNEQSTLPKIQKKLSVGNMIFEYPPNEDNTEKKTVNFVLYSNSK